MRFEVEHDRPTKGPGTTKGPDAKTSSLQHGLTSRAQGVILWMKVGFFEEKNRKRR